MRPSRYGRNINYKISRDERLDNVKISESITLPYIDSNTPPGTYAGKIAWDVVTMSPYYSTGSEWLPIGTGAPGTVESYSHVKGVDQTINPDTPSTITGWVGSGDSYHTIPQWNLTTGVYQSDASEIVTISVNISWKGGISNLGNRIVRLVKYDALTTATSTVKESVTQADPNNAVDTTQEFQINVKMRVGDLLYVQVEHDAPTPLVIEGGNSTSVCGTRLN